VNASIATHILLGIIQSKCPQILFQPRNPKHSQDTPVLSIWKVRDFLRRELNWTVRWSTKAGQKLPVSWEELCEKTFFQFVTTILKEDIHQSLLINLDQTGIILIPGGTQRTYDEKGIHQVALHGKEEKRAFTVVLITSANGSVLSVQAVWKGKSERSLPSLAVDKSRRTEAESAGFRFVLNAKNHWSNLDTMQQLITNIILPYRQRMITKYHLSSMAKVILYWDCWKVHWSEAMRNWVKENYSSWLILIFVPAGCTGVFQPCDVGLQRVFKHHIQLAAGEFFVEEVKKQLDRGNTPEEIRICDKIGPLRNQTPGWLLDSVNYLNHPDREQLHLKAWKNCKVKNWNLSWESLTTGEAGRSFWRLLSEIRSAITGDNAVGGNDLESEQESENIIDGDDVPLDVLEEAVHHGPHREPVVFPTGYR